MRSGGTCRRRGPGGRCGRLRGFRRRSTAPPGCSPTARCSAAPPRTSVLRLLPRRPGGRTAGPGLARGAAAGLHGPGGRPDRRGRHARAAEEPEDDPLPAGIAAVADAARLLRFAGWASPALRLDRVVDRALSGVRRSGSDRDSAGWHDSCGARPCCVVDHEGLPSVDVRERVIGCWPRRSPGSSPASPPARADRRRARVGAGPRRGDGADPWLRRCSPSSRCSCWPSASPRCGPCWTAGARARPPRSRCWPRSRRRRGCCASDPAGSCPCSPVRSCSSRRSRNRSRARRAARSRRVRRRGRRVVDRRPAPRRASRAVPARRARGGGAARPRARCTGRRRGEHAAQRRGRRAADPPVRRGSARRLPPGARDRRRAAAVGHPGRGRRGGRAAAHRRGAAAQPVSAAGSREPAARRDRRGLVGRRDRGARRRAGRAARRLPALRLARVVRPALMVLLPLAVVQLAVVVALTVLAG